MSQVVVVGKAEAYEHMGDSRASPIGRHGTYLE
jgi:hypothetical protein